MSYLSKETSVDDGVPVELYTIRYKQNIWYYTSSDEIVIHNAREFLPLTIRRSELISDPSEPFGELEVDIPRGTPVGELFRVTPPSSSVTITCERFHLSDSENENVVFFRGQIVNVETEFSYVRLLCQSSGHTINRIGLRQHYQVECPHMLYGGQCGVNRDLYKTTGIVGSISGVVLNVQACINGEDDFFAGGYLEYTHSSLGTLERIAVSSSNGSTGDLTLFSHPVGLNFGDAVAVFDGCDRTFVVCKAKFNNAENYGGLPFIPGKNPFTDNPLF